MPDLEEHITFKELKAVRCAIQSILPELKGKPSSTTRRQPVGDRCADTPHHQVLNHDVRVSEAIFLLIDTYDINIRTLYIRSAANVWADNLSRITDKSDWQMAPRKFKYFNTQWGPYSIKRFASFTNKQVHR